MYKKYVMKIKRWLGISKYKLFIGADFNSAQFKIGNKKYSLSIRGGGMDNLSNIIHGFSGCVDDYIQLSIIDKIAYIRERRNIVYEYPSRFILVYLNGTKSFYFTTKYNIEYLDNDRIIAKEDIELKKIVP